MRDFGAAALATVLAGWWIVSAYNQFRAGAGTLRLRRHLPVGLIPLWTFFAPNPVCTDVRVVWREEDAPGWSPWRELHFGFAPAYGRWLINPELILNKAISDLVRSLLRLDAAHHDRTVLLSSAYVLLLSLVMHQPCSGERSAIQFAVVRTSGVEQPRRPEIVFLSEIHEAVEVRKLAVQS